MMTYGTYLSATNSYTTGTIWPFVKLDLGEFLSCPSLLVYSFTNRNRLCCRELEQVSIRNLVKGAWY